MNISIGQKLDAVRKYLPYSLNDLLALWWWILIVVVIGLLLLDGAVFFLYGLGNAESYQGVTPDIFRLREEAIRSVADELRLRRQRFNDANTMPPDFPNPFR